MPNFAFLALAGCSSAPRGCSNGTAINPRPKRRPRNRAPAAVEAQDVSWDDVVPVDVLALEVAIG
jgi:hypothetical protein